LFFEYTGIHRSRPKQPQSSGIADRRSQLPSAAPDHPGLDDGEINIKQRSYPGFAF
jgi:hypothetical protein